MLCSLAKLYKLYEIFKNKIFVGAQETTKCMKVLVLEVLGYIIMAFVYLLYAINAYVCNL